MLAACVARGPMIELVQVALAAESIAPPADADAAIELPKTHAYVVDAWWPRRRERRAPPRAPRRGRGRAVPVALPQVEICPYYPLLTYYRP